MVSDKLVKKVLKGQTFEEVIEIWGKEQPEISLEERRKNPQLNNSYSDPDAFFKLD